MLQQPAKIQIVAVEILENRVSPGYNHHALTLPADHFTKKFELADELPDVRLEPQSIWSPET
jgi:hypothetical protein